MTYTTAIDRAQLGSFCTRHHVLRLSLFGSILTERFGPESDIDILVEFVPGQEPGLFALAGMEAELGEIFGRKVDLRTPAELSPLFRDQVLAAAVLQYAA